MHFKPGDLVRARRREWVVLPETRSDLLKVRPLGGTEEDATLIYVPLEQEAPTPASFDPPCPNKPGSQQAALLLRDALRLKLRAGAGPFRSFGNLNFEPRVYQLVPLLMALKLDPIRLLVADDVGVGKTIEAGLIARELIDRGEIDRFTVICPPHLCDQWQRELADKFAIDTEIVRTGTARRLERGLRPNESVFEVYQHTVVSLDYIKSDRRRDDFLRACPEFVIVDEIHTCVQSNTNTRHQRYQLLKGLAEGEPRRQMVFLTATPHSGDETAFHNLLGLLDPKFAQLADLKDRNERSSLRSELAKHFVQRRRGDISEWRDSAGFPVRESREAMYRSTGQWGSFFERVFAYARELVQRAEDGSMLEQRMSWWAALALLRCVSSSPAAASLTLRTRLQATQGETEQATIRNLDQAASLAVFDEGTDDFLTQNEGVPAGTLDAEKDAAKLEELIREANKLRGRVRDPKLKILIREVKDLIKNGFRPVVFCRFIATAHYVGDELVQALPRRSTRISVVTGKLPPSQREEEVGSLAELDEGVTPVLVATDCLSEGVNLQEAFNAVIHYDLSWNPTRHEQREGRADRFGQASKTVRTLMLYGEDNPVDGAVLRVILRKAEKIRKELGVTVPLPANNKVIDAIMEAVLLSRRDTAPTRRALMDFGEIEHEVENSWQTAKILKTRTVFAQRRLRPDQVLPEWQKSMSVLGGQDDVERFVRVAAERIGTGIERRNGISLLPVSHFPAPLAARLNSIGLQKTAKITFTRPAPAGVTYIYRSHPLVSALADYVAEQALDLDLPNIGARTSAMFTEGVHVRTVLFLLRVRCLIQISRRGSNRRFSHWKSLLAEECLGLAVRGNDAPELLAEDKALSLLSLEPSRNMEEGQKIAFVKQALSSIGKLEPHFESIARERAKDLLADHRRIRDASDTKGFRYEVTPALPVDKIGVYVLIPTVSF
ncbi:MAG: helicase-related protein [Rhodobacteraceae bacterium]|nr:helicase-related protein [Paracoccaceae bacterium]